MQGPSQRQQSIGSARSGRFFQRAAAFLLTQQHPGELVPFCHGGTFLRHIVPPIVALGTDVLQLVALQTVSDFLGQAGLASQRLAERMVAAGDSTELPDLPRRRSGRIERNAADAWFAERRAVVEGAPDDWRGWFRMAQAYDLAGDRRRAREALRTAIEKAD